MNNYLQIHQKESKLALKKIKEIQNNENSIFSKEEFILLTCKSMVEDIKRKFEKRLFNLKGIPNLDYSINIVISYSNLFIPLNLQQIVFINHILFYIIDWLKKIYKIEIKGYTALTKENNFVFKFYIFHKLN